MNWRNKDKKGKAINVVTVDELQKRIDTAEERISDTPLNVLIEPNGSIKVSLDDNSYITVVSSDGAQIFSVNALPSGDLVNMYQSVNAIGGTAKFLLTDVSPSSFQIDTLGGVDIDSNEGVTINDDSGSMIRMSPAGRVDIDSASGQLVDITSNTEVNISGGVLTSINSDTINLTASTAVNISGPVYATGVVSVGRVSGKHLTFRIHGTLTGAQIYSAMTLNGLGDGESMMLSGGIGNGVYTTGIAGTALSAAVRSGTTITLYGMGVGYTTENEITVDISSVDATSYRCSICW